MYTYNYTRIHVSLRHFRLLAVSIPEPCLGYNLVARCYENQSLRIRGILETTSSSSNSYYTPKYSIEDPSVQATIRALDTDRRSGYGHPPEDV